MEKQIKEMSMDQVYRSQRLVILVDIFAPFTREIIGHHKGSLKSTNTLFKAFNEKV